MYVGDPCARSNDALSMYLFEGGPCSPFGPNKVICSRRRTRVPTSWVGVLASTCEDHSAKTNQLDGLENVKIYSMQWHLLCDRTMPRANSPTNFFPVRDKQLKLDPAETNVGGAVLLDATGKRADRVEQFTGLSYVCNFNTQWNPWGSVSKSNGAGAVYWASLAAEQATQFVSFRSLPVAWIHSNQIFVSPPISCSNFHRIAGSQITKMYSYNLRVFHWSC